MTIPFEVRLSLWESELHVIDPASPPLAHALPCFAPPGLYRTVFHLFQRSNRDSRRFATRTRSDGVRAFVRPFRRLMPSVSKQLPRRVHGIDRAPKGLDEDRDPRGRFPSRSLLVPQGRSEGLGGVASTFRIESTHGTGIRRKHRATTLACVTNYAKRLRHGRGQSEGPWWEQPADEWFGFGSRLTAPPRTSHVQTEDYELACLASCETSVRELTLGLAELDGFVRRIREAHREVRQQLQERATATCEEAPDSDAFEMLADLLWKYNDMFRLRGSFQVDPISPSFVHRAQEELMEATSALCEGPHRDRLHLALQPALTPSPNHVLQFCGKEMDPQASIGDYVSGHEKTTMLLRLGSRGQVLPTCPHVDEETQKALIAYCYRKEQQEKTSKPCELTDATSAWSDPTSLQRALQGITNLRMH